MFENVVYAVENDEANDEEYVLDDYSEKILEIMQNYEYDYKKIAQDIFKGKIDFPVYCINNYGHYEKLYDNLCNISKHNGGPMFDFLMLPNALFHAYDEESKKIKYEKGILKIGNLEIKDVNDISQIFDTFVECLTEHGEYLKRYLQKKAELDEKLGFLDEEDTNISENKTDDLF
ncbi:hypothetical protein [Sneathia sanguinegens]|uniref:hypothetical protein n=1 Tax=Sneathia sanguinegens TaxID=40543 RepID=UPI00290E712D|nr:hypothetical protein [Sneathia sanguinegens]MDU7496957.1 hypothetical protein [Sneathia sanguinegens]